MNLEFFTAVAAGTIRSGTPVLYATLGEVVTERAGVLNLGLEGIMLVGAWIGIVVAYHTGQPALAVLAAAGAGALLGLLHGVLCVRFGANQLAAGVAMTLFGAGASAYLGVPFVGQRIATLSTIELPMVSNWPVVGSALFSHDALIYGSYLLVPLVSWFLNHTRPGLAIVAVGQDPHAAAAAGVRVEAVRYLTTAFGAALAAVGGAHLSLVFAQGWIENLTGGRGLVAVGLVIFARWSPARSVLGAWLFGGALALQLRLQASGTDVSPHLLAMAPYVLVATVLIVSTIRLGTARTGMPAALSTPYVRQS